MDAARNLCTDSDVKVHITAEPWRVPFGNDRLDLRALLFGTVAPTRRGRQLLRPDLVRSFRAQLCWGAVERHSVLEHP